MFREYRAYKMNAAQRILRATVLAGGTAQISAKSFVDAYRLPSPSTVRSSVADLVGRDLIERSPSGYRVYDRLFDIWLAALGPMA